jgi:hypothetical protein
VRPGSLRPALRRGQLPASRRRSPGGRAARCGVGSRVAVDGLAGRSGSERIGCGHAGMWPTAHRPARCKRRSPRCSIKCPQGNDGAVRHRRRRVPRRSGGWSTRCTYVGFLGLLGSEDARTAGGRCARPLQAWARRRRGDSAGNLTRVGRGGAKGDGVRGGVHARQATHAGE